MTNTTKKQTIIERIMWSQIFEYTMKMIWMMMLLLTSSELIRKDKIKQVKILFTMIRCQIINKSPKVQDYLKMCNESFLCQISFYFFYSLLSTFNMKLFFIIWSNKVEKYKYQKWCLPYLLPIWLAVKNYCKKCCRFSLFLRFITLFITDCLALSCSDLDCPRGFYNDLLFSCYCIDKYYPGRIFEPLR